MPSIPRKTQKIFGGSLTPANNVAVYGSLAAGAPAYPSTITDLTAIQSAAWLQGLTPALIGNRSPALEDLNGVFLVLSQQIAYLLQSGIPEWIATETYWIGQIVRFPGTALCFTSTVNNNLGNDPSVDSNNWSASGTSNPSIASMGSSQSVEVDSVGHTLAFNVSEYDPFARYNVSTYRYTAPVAGAYLITANTQADYVGGSTTNDAAALETMELSLTAVKNGTTILRAAGTSVATPPGQRWYPKLSTTVVLALGDTVEIQLLGACQTDVGAPNPNLNVSNSDWSIHKLP
jgi:hypothetical protein